MRYACVCAIAVLVMSTVGFAMAGRKINTALYNQTKETEFQKQQLSLSRDEVRDLGTVLSLICRRQSNGAELERLKECVGNLSASRMYCKVRDMDELLDDPGAMSGLSVLIVCENRRESGRNTINRDKTEYVWVLFGTADLQIVDVLELFDSTGITWGDDWARITGRRSNRDELHQYRVTPTGFELTD